MSDTPTPDPKPDEAPKGDSFTQADVDRIVADRLKREREKFADYDDLKKQAAGAKTAEDRISELEKSVADANREALRRRVQAKHGISDEDADLFLTGGDETSLEAQAKRLAERETERKKQANTSPREGTIPTGDKPDDMRDFARKLFSDAAG